MKVAMSLQEIQTKNKEKTLVVRTSLSFDATVRSYRSVGLGSGAWSVSMILLMVSTKEAFKQ
jgi:hypothetical protein